MNKAYKAIKPMYIWSNMKKEIEDYVNKRLPMKITTTADHPYEKSCLNIVGP
jgi:hypothetical protein